MRFPDDRQSWPRPWPETRCGSAEICRCSRKHGSRLLHLSWLQRVISDVFSTQIFFAPKQVTHIRKIGGQLVTWMNGKDTMRCCNRRPFVLIRTAGSLIGINLQLEQGEQCEQTNATTALSCPSTQNYTMLYMSCPSMLNKGTNGD